MWNQCIKQWAPATPQTTSTCLFTILFTMINAYPIIHHSAIVSSLIHAIMGQPRQSKLLFQTPHYIGGHFLIPLVSRVNGALVGIWLKHVNNRCGLVE